MFPFNDQKETEQKDYQWSKGSIPQRQSMIKRKHSKGIQSKKTINNQKETEHICFPLTIDSLCVLFPFDHWWSFCSVSFWSLIVFLFCFLLIIDSPFVLFPRKQNTKTQWSKGNRTHRLSMIKRKENKKTINDQKETGHKDYQWSKGNNRLWAMFPFDHWYSVCSVSFWTLIVCILFPFDHWQSFCSVSIWSLTVFLFCFHLIIDSLFVLLTQWSKGNRTHRLSMIKRKENKKTINDQKETGCSVSFWSLIVFLLCFLLIIDNRCVLFPFDHR
jgi:uncharacterized protein (DUF2249 family)